MLAFLQRIGRSLMIPIAVMPAAALLNRLGAPDVLNIPFIQAAGSEIFVYLALLFAIGIAIGMSSDQRGEAVLAAVVGYFVLLKAMSVLLINVGGYSETDAIVSNLPSNILIGIIAGLVTVWAYNRFYTTRLPEALGFFSGRRLVPILVSVFMLVVAAILAVIWPPIWDGINSLNSVILTMGALGTAVFGFFNRLLIPLGLHQVLNSYFWFGLGEYVTAEGVTVTGDIPRFLAGDPTAGPYQVGFYPIMMFGLMGAALAITRAAKPENRKAIAGLMGSAALVSFVTGITEPIEFAFVFVAPFLYLIHALLTGLSMYVTNYLGLRAGFGFSAGLLDYLLNFGLAEGPILLAGVGVLFFFGYFIIFAALIRLFNLKTPGREAADQTAEATLQAQAALAGSDIGAGEFGQKAAGIYMAVGGAENLTAVDSCASRLRLTVNDSAAIDENKLMALGAAGVVKPSKHAAQVIMSDEVEPIAEELKKILALAPPVVIPTLAMAADEEKTSAETAVSVPEPTIDHDLAASRASSLLQGLGGAANVATVGAAAQTRVRVSVKDPSKVNEENLRIAGARGIMVVDGNTLHLLLGKGAAEYGAEMQAQIIEKTAV